MVRESLFVEIMSEPKPESRGGIKWVQRLEWGGGRGMACTEAATGRSMAQSYGLRLNRILLVLKGKVILKKKVKS